MINSPGSMFTVPRHAAINPGVRFECTYLFNREDIIKIELDTVFDQVVEEPWVAV